MPDEPLKRDGVTWVALGHAARISKTKMVEIEAMIARGEISALSHDGRTWITLGTANRLKRETSTIRSIRRKSKLGDMIPAGSRWGLFDKSWDPSPGPARLPLPLRKRKKD